MFRARIQVQSRSVELGYFDDEKAAARAYDKCVHLSCGAHGRADADGSDDAGDGGGDGGHARPRKRRCTKPGSQGRTEPPRKQSSEYRGVCWKYAPVQCMRACCSLLAACACSAVRKQASSTQAST